MNIEKTDRAAPLAVGEVRLSTDPRAVGEHIASYEEERQRQVDACIRTGRAYEKLLPALLEDRRASVERLARALLEQDSADGMSSILNLLLRLGESDAVRGLAWLLGNSRSSVRRTAVIDLRRHSVDNRANKDALEIVFKSSEKACADLQKMLFEADRWNRRLAVELCDLMDLRFDDDVWHRLVCEPPHHHAETEFVIAFLAKRGQDLGALDLAIKLIDDPAFQSVSVLKALLAALRDFIRYGNVEMRERAQRKLLAFLQGSEQPPSSFTRDTWFNVRASAIEALAASSSEAALIALNEIARRTTEEPYHRYEAWCGLLARSELQTWTEFMASHEADDAKGNAAYRLLHWAKPGEMDTRLALAMQLSAIALPASVRKIVVRFLRHHGRLEAAAPGDSGALCPPGNRAFDDLDVPSAAERLVQIGAIDAEEAAAAVECARTSKGIRAQPADVLQCAEVIAAFDAESSEVCPHYSELLSELGANSRKRFLPRAVVQTWHCREGHEADSVCVVRFACDDTLIEYAAAYHGDYYDVRTTLRAANAVLEAKGTAQRFVPLGTGDQMMAAAFCTPDAAPDLAQLIGMKVETDPDAAMHAGRAYAARVRAED